MESPKDGQVQFYEERGSIGLWTDKDISTDNSRKKR